MDAFDIELAEAAEQRSQAWRDVRAGRFTASEIFKLFVEPRSNSDKAAGKWSDTAMTYIKTKVAEEITGQIHVSSAAMPLVRGVELEDEAKAFYEAQYNDKIEFAGFKIYTEHAGGSPDGYLKANGLAEIKCPFNSANQIEYLLIKSAAELYEFKPEYVIQCQANLLFTGRDFCNFIAYDPRFNLTNHKMHVIRIDKDATWHERITEKLTKAIEEKLKIIKQLPS